MSREHILNELEKFHQGKLDEVRAKRAANAQPTQAGEIVSTGAVSIRVDPARKEVILSFA